VDSLQYPLWNRPDKRWRSSGFCPVPRRGRSYWWPAPNETVTQNCVNSLVHEWTLFNISQQIQEDIWIHGYWCVPTWPPGEEGRRVSCHAGGNFIRWPARGFRCLEPPPVQPHFPTEHHSKRVTQEERQKQGGGGGEEQRAGSPSPTPQHVYRPGSVMCPQAGHQPAIVTEGGIKPPKLSHCHYQKNLSAKVWLGNSVLPGCGDQNRSLWREDTRIWTGLVTPCRINKWLGKAKKKKHLNSFPTFLYLFLSLFVL